MNFKKPRIKLEPNPEPRPIDGFELFMQNVFKVVAAAVIILMVSGMLIAITLDAVDLFVNDKPLHFGRPEPCRFEYDKGGRAISTWKNEKTVVNREDALKKIGEFMECQEKRK